MSTEQDTPDPNAAVLAALARLEARMNAGFKDVDGRFDDVNARIDQTTTEVRELRGEVGELRLGLVDLRTEVREGRTTLEVGQASILSELHGTRKEAGKELAEHDARIKSLEKPKRTGTR